MVLLLAIIGGITLFLNICAVIVLLWNYVQLRRRENLSLLRSWGDMILRAILLVWIFSFVCMINTIREFTEN